MLTGRRSLSLESLGASDRLSPEGSSEEATRYMGSTLSFIPMVVRQAKYERVGGMVDLGLVGSWYDRPLDSTAVAKAQAVAAACTTVWWTGSACWYGVPTPSHDLMMIGENYMFALYEVVK